MSKSIAVKGVLSLPEGAVNVNMVQDDKGNVWIGFNPNKSIRDAGTTRTFRGNKSDPKATNTVAKLGSRTVNTITIDGKARRVMFYIGDEIEQPSNGLTPAPELVDLLG